jgi:hypothetical protein
MSVAEPWVVTAPAVGDLSGALYRFVSWNGSGGVALVGSAGAAATNGLAGVLYNSPRSGEAASVAVEGYARVYCQNSVAPQTFITTGASGGVVAAASGDIVLGRAMEKAVPGDVMEVRLGTPWRLVGAVN